MEDKIIEKLNQMGQQHITKGWTTMKICEDRYAKLILMK
mgnify:CR=1 FL=1